MTVHMQDAQTTIDPDIATLARVKLTVWVIVITGTLTVGGISFAVQQHSKDIDQLKEKKAESASVVEKIDALYKLEEQRAESFHQRLLAIEEFQRAQAEAAMKAAAARAEQGR